MTDPLRDLEARLHAVEVRLGIEPPAAREPLPAAGDPGVYWVVEGLRERLAGVPGGGVVLAGTVETTVGPVEWQYGLGTEALLELDEGGADSAAARLAALGHHVRLQLLLAVLNGHTSPAALAELAGMGTTGQVYHHVRTLTAAGWLRSSGRGQLQVPAERIVPLLVAITAAL